MLFLVYTVSVFTENYEIKLRLQSRLLVVIAAIIKRMKELTNDVRDKATQSNWKKLQAQVYTTKTERAKHYPRVGKIFLFKFLSQITLDIGFFTPPSSTSTSLKVVLSFGFCSVMVMSYHFVLIIMA